MMDVRILKAILLSLTLSFSGISNAGLITEIDDAGSFIEDAQWVVDGTTSVSGYLSSNNDVDMFYFNWAGGSFDISISTNWDPMLWLFNTSSEIVSFNDDYSGLQSRIFIGSLATGSYGLAVNSFPNCAIDINNICSISVGHTLDHWSNVGWSSGSYLITLNSAASNSVTLNSVASVPEPSTIAIFALGIMGLALRRFKKQ